MSTVKEYLKNDKWVRRVGEYFTQLDMNKNGYLSKEDWMLTCDTLEKAAPDRPAEVAKLRQISSEFTDALGLTKGVQGDRKKFAELFAAFSLAEMARVKKGEISLTEKLDNAIFDVVDRNHDGRITFDEFKIVMKSYGFNEDVGKPVFASMDKNKNGTIERKEFIESDMKFWYTLDDPGTQGMLGDKYE